MERFKNILVVYNLDEGTEAALRQATELAIQNGARLTIAQVVENLPARGRHKFLEERWAHIERLGAWVGHKQVRVEVVVLVGTPFLEIIREVIRKRCDLLIMTAESQQSVGGLLFGSTSMHLMRKCPCPVWVMKAGQIDRFVRVLAAVDTSTSQQEKDALNRKIMDLATSLARSEQCELHIVHAWELIGNDRVTMSSELTQKMQSQLIRRNRAARQKPFDALLGSCDLKDVNHQEHLVRGSAITVLPKMAQELQIDLVVMGTVGRVGIPGYFMGNVAEDVLHLVDCSVLTVKPVNFITPVTLEV